MRREGPKEKGKTLTRMILLACENMYSECTVKYPFSLSHNLVHTCAHKANSKCRFNSVSACSDFFFYLCFFFFYKPKHTKHLFKKYSGTLNRLNPTITLDRLKALIQGLQNSGLGPIQTRYFHLNSKFGGDLSPMFTKCPFGAASLYQPALCLISRHLAAVGSTRSTIVIMMKCCNYENRMFQPNVAVKYGPNMP